MVEAAGPQQAQPHPRPVQPRGRDVLLGLAAGTDVVIENFRPGTLERWGIGPAELHAVNPRLVLARVTGFGQFGPYSHRPASARSRRR
ncbi:hypothetical protein Sfulv_13190 [Streptomyces fulvorobeus]|uniref:CoA transferase n=1 Tax=Streptomyces fulvorobeus TaxID=284028 RepID=A0A7J0C282_9ACTN|nr:hypothetical protein Sfulv_13190 [Streptomyces fulvorobeus]